MDGFLPFIADWAVDVKRITETPDYWADIKRIRVLFTDIRDSHGTGNTLFTEDEQHKIAAQLRGIRKSLTERFELSDEQLERITDKLDEAEEASRRMGRKDWLLLFSGTIFSVIITDIVTPTVAEHIFTAVIHGIAHLFSGGSEPPQIPPPTIGMTGSVNAFYTLGKSAGVALVTTLLVEYLDASRQPAEVRETPDPYSHRVGGFVASKGVTAARSRRLCV